MEGPIREEVDSFLEVIGKFDGKPFDLKNIIQNSTSNVICAMAFGKRFDFDDPKFLQLMGNFDVMFEAMTSFGLANQFPFLQVITTCFSLYK